MAVARATAVGVVTGAGKSGETVFRRGAGAGGAARVDQLLQRVNGLTRFDSRLYCDAPVYSVRTCQIRYPYPQTRYPTPHHHPPRRRVTVQ